MKTGTQTKVNYKVMSDKVCSECGHPIKQNIVLRNPHVKLCFNCFKLSQGKRYFFVKREMKDRLEIQKQNIIKYKGGAK